MAELEREQAREIAQRIFDALDDSNQHLAGRYDSLSVERPCGERRGYRVVLYCDDWTQGVRLDRAAAVCGELGLPFLVLAGEGEEVVFFDSADPRFLSV